METLLVTCANCGTANRVPRERFFRGGREAARVSGAMDARSLSGWLARELGA
jgi:thioredoxin family protein